VNDNFIRLYICNLLAVGPFITLRCWSCFYL